MISIAKELNVDASQEATFRVFTAEMDLWWPRSHHVGRTPMVKMVLEPKRDGRWYSTHEDGEVCAIGYVQNYEPNSRVVLVWKLNGDFKYDQNLHTEVELNFTATGPNTTRVTFEHRNVETLGKSIEGMDQGWGMILDLYAKVAKVGKLEGNDLAIYRRLTAAE